MTKEITTAAATVAAATEQKAPTTNAEIRQYMTGSAMDFLAIKEESLKNALVNNPDLDLEKASRRVNHDHKGGDHRPLLMTQRRPTPRSKVLEKIELPQSPPYKISPTVRHPYTSPRRAPDNDPYIKG